jgi:flagellum-specific peptidoglycan hydrolase FlgJ
VTAYLRRYKSPLASFAAEIVSEADKAGIDDRFIVALAGRETSYGTNPTWNSASAGIYNVFSNSQHCAGPGLSMCQAFSAYSSYTSAIDDAVATISSSKYYAGLNSADDIYNQYNYGALVNNAGVPYGPDKILDDIYGGSRLRGDLSNVRSPRCQ